MGLALGQDGFYLQLSPRVGWHATLLARWVSVFPSARWGRRCPGHGFSVIRDVARHVNAARDSAGAHGCSASPPPPPSPSPSPSASPCPSPTQALTRPDAARLACSDGVGCVQGGVAGGSLLLLLVIRHLLNNLGEVEG